MSMNRLLLIICTLPILIGCDTKQTGAGSNTATNQSQDLPLPKTRHEFAKAMARVKEGMPKARVRAILGEPHDVRTRQDPGGIHVSRTTEIWRYGTNGHLTTATLGEVHIDVNDNAQYVFGAVLEPPPPLPSGFTHYGHGTLQPPPSSMFDEEELRELLRIIDRLRGDVGSQYDPLRVVQAVNSLQPLGKEKALAAISEYLRVTSRFHSSPRRGLFVVLRVLFEVPKDPGYMPYMRTGEYSPPKPKDAKLIPRFPVVLQDDIPFVLVAGIIMWHGGPQAPEEHVEHFRKNGNPRSKPLSPSARPFEALDKIVKSPSWFFTDDGWLSSDGERYALTEQLLWLFRNVYRTTPGIDQRRFSPEGDPENRWKTIVDHFSRLKIRWDEQKSIYTFEDGSYLLDEVPVIYRRKIWVPKINLIKASLIFERKTTRHIDAILEVSVCGPHTLPATVRVYTVGKESEALAAFTVKEGMGQYLRVELPEGEEVRAEWSNKDGTFLSPVYKP